MSLDCGRKPESASLCRVSNMNICIHLSTCICMHIPCSVDTLFTKVSNLFVLVFYSFCHRSGLSYHLHVNIQQPLTHHLDVLCRNQKYINLLCAQLCVNPLGSQLMMESIFIAYICPYVYLFYHLVMTYFFYSETSLV